MSSRRTDAAARSLRHGRWARLARPAAVAGTAVVVGVALHVVDPNEQGSYPTCPFLALTGWYCPGCGSLRALHAMTNLDVATALARNPLATIAFGWLAGWFLVWARRRWLGRPRLSVAAPWLIYALAVVVIGYGVLRNLPGMTLLSPA